MSEERFRFAICCDRQSVMSKLLSQTLPSSSTVIVSPHLSSTSYTIRVGSIQFSIKWHSQCSFRSFSNYVSLPIFFLSLSLSFFSLHPMSLCTLVPTSPVVWIHTACMDLWHFLSHISRKTVRRSNYHILVLNCTSFWPGRHHKFHISMHASHLTSVTADLPPIVWIF